MSANDPNSDTLHSFQINAGDVRTLWNHLLGFACQNLSPFAEADGDLPSREGPATDVAVLKTLARNPVLANAAAILSNPELELECVVGGGSSPLGHVTLYRRRDLDAQSVIALTPSVSNSFLIHCFDDAETAARWLARMLGRMPDFVAWDLDTLSEVAATLEMPRDLPDEMPLETLIYLLHVIDVFRRAVYHNLLRYEPVDAHLTVAAEEFDDSLKTSIRSGDIRWLLPAFHRLTPSLDAFRVEPRPQHLAMLEQCDLIRPGRSADSGKAYYTFGETGTRVGIEFYRTWHTAAGIALSLRGRPNPPHLRCFLAPTAFANHLFVLDARRDARGSVRHKGLTEPELARSLRKILDTPQNP